MSVRIAGFLCTLGGMRIAVDTRMLLPDRLEGIGRFCAETFRRIVQSRPGDDFIFLFDRPFDRQFLFGENVSGMVVGPPSSHPALWMIRYGLNLPRIINGLKPDLLVSPNGLLPHRTNIPTVAVIHDLNFEHHSGYLPPLSGMYLRRFTGIAANRCTRIATVSAFTGQDIIQRYSIATDKIDVVYNGVNESFVPLTDAAIDHTRRRYTDGLPYFLYTGSIHPRKNTANVLQGFDRFKKRTGAMMKLVFAGSKRTWTPEFEQAFRAMEFSGDVVFTGRIPEEELIALTGAAFAVTYISNFEGFGIPVLEGMRAGVPVITSDRTAMPEVAGGAALTVNPHDPISISEAMERILTEEELRASLIEKGNLRCRDFSWDKTAAGLWRCMELAMNR